MLVIYIYIFVYVGFSGLCCSGSERSHTCLSLRHHGRLLPRLEHGRFRLASCSWLSCTLLVLSSMLHVSQNASGLGNSIYGYVQFVIYSTFKILNPFARYKLKHIWSSVKFASPRTRTWAEFQDFIIGKTMVSVLYQLVYTREKIIRIGIQLRWIQIIYLNSREHTSMELARSGPHQYGASSGP